MKYIPVLLFAFISFTLHSQETKRVKQKTPDREKEVFFVLKENPSVRHGTYVRTDRYDKLAEKGYYKMGKRDSTWVEYSNGWLMASGMYEDDLKTGSWKKYNGNEVSSSVNYVNGKLQPEETYYINGKPAQTFNLSTKELIWADSSLEGMPPRYIGGDEKMMHLIKINTIYPIQEKEKSIQGYVFISFVIDSVGGTSDFKVEKSLSPGLDKEALRIAGLLNGWLPAIHKGQPVRSRINIPIRFILL